MMVEHFRDHITLDYKHSGRGEHILLDIYPPPSLKYASEVDSIPKHPTVVYFHGGGLLFGNRKSFLPTWLIDRTLAKGWTFVSADYHLLTPPTARDIKKDVIDLFKYLVDTEFEYFSNKDFGTNNVKRFKVDADKMAVSGGSGGGLPAYLAATFAVPKPKALLNFYAMGGNFLLPFYIKPKVEPFFPGEELLGIEEHSHLLYPFVNGPLPIETDIYYPQSPPPNWNERSVLRRLTIQLGNWTDHYTGAYNPSLSESLQDVLVEFTDNSKEQTEILEALIPNCFRDLYPQINAKEVETDWPPTMLVHGDADTAVLIKESEHMRDVLESVGAPVELVVVEGAEHGFDIALPPRRREEKWGWLFDKTFEFLQSAVDAPNS